MSTDVVGPGGTMGPIGPARFVASAEPFGPTGPPPTQTSVLASIGKIGASDLAQIKIDITALKAVALPERTVMLMVTYESLNQVYVADGNFSQVATAKSATLTPWNQSQTAVFLVCKGVPKSNTLVLNFSPFVSGPVQWRAAGVVADGVPTDPRLLGVGFGVGPLGLPEMSSDPANVSDLAFAFFASAQAMPTMSDPTRIVKRAEVVDTAPSPTHRIQCYNWNGLGATAMGTSTWFYTYIKIRWNAPLVSPPSASDNFWAYAAPCDASDVLLINNNAQAPYWDIPEWHIEQLPDTLLLNYIESNGTRWMLNEMEGWWTLPPPALPDLPRPGYLDGSFPVDGRYEPRIITIQGTFWPGAGRSVAEGRLRLLRSLDAVRSGALLVVKEPVWTKQSWVWLSDRPNVESVLGGKTTFDVQLKAVDPVKYHAGVAGLIKELIPFSGAIDGRTYDPYNFESGLRFEPTQARAYADTEPIPMLRVTNLGTANVYPRIFLFGPMLDPVVINFTTNQYMVYQGAINPGEVLVTDCYWRTVVMRPSDTTVIDDGYPNDSSGTNKRHMLKLSSPWMYMAPGLNEVYYKANSVNLPPTPPDPDDALPVNMTQGWVVFRSGWTGS
jgi:Phage tail protein